MFGSTAHATVLTQHVARQGKASLPISARRQTAEPIHSTARQATQQRAVFQSTDLPELAQEPQGSCCLEPWLPEICPYRPRILIFLLPQAAPDAKMRTACPEEPKLTAKRY